MYRSMRAKQRGFWNFVIPAVAAVAGGLLSNRSKEKQAEQAAQATTDANIYNTDAQERMNAKNLEAQKEFAQHGISWKVEDSKAAGLHPLFGAGLSGATFSPSFQVSPKMPVPVREADDYSWLSQLGQLMGNYFGREEAKKAQANYAMQGDPSQSVTITEHPGGGRTMVMPIQGLESQVSGRPLDAPMQTMDFRGNYQDAFNLVMQDKAGGDPLSKKHIVETPDKAGAFWQRFNFGHNFQTILPKTSEPQEVFEDKPLWFWAMVAKANVKEYGPGWLTQARSQFPSLREVYDGVKQELKASGLIPKGW